MSDGPLPSMKDPCRCGSGKKYAKCCLEKDAADFVQNLSRDVIELRAAAFQVQGRHYVPAIACCDQNRKCLNVLTRSMESGDASDATESAYEDLVFAPRAPGIGTVTKARLVYLYGVGYRIIPKASSKQLTLWDDLNESNVDPSKSLLDSESQEEVPADTSEVRQHLTRLTSPEYAREPFDRVFQIKLAIANVDWPAWRWIQIPETYTFWDLHVAIHNAFLWRFHSYFKFVVPDLQRNRMKHYGLEWTDPAGGILPAWRESLAAHLSLKTPIMEYLANSANEPWLISVVLEAILDRAPDKSYPLSLRGQGAAPPEDIGGPTGFLRTLAIMRDPLHRHHDSVVQTYGTDFDLESFDPQDVVFDDPDEEWIFTYWEQWIISGSHGDLEDAEDLLLPDGRYPVRLPVRWRNLLVAEGLASAGVLDAITDECVEHGFVTVLVTKQDVDDLMDVIARKIFESRNVRLCRQLERLSWHLEEIQEELEYIGPFEDDED